MYKVLIVDDEPWAQKDLKTVINWENAGFFIAATAQNASEAILQIEKIKPDLMCADIAMPGMNGVELIKYLKDHDYDVLSVLISAYGEFDYARRAMACGALGYLLKPVDESELFEALARAKTILDDTQEFVSDNIVTEPSRLDSIRNKRYASEAVCDMLEYIEHHYDEKLMISQLGERLHLNPGYLGNLFKKETGITFTGYLVSKRLEKAAELLAASRLTLPEISRRVGYDDYFHFSKLFKKYKNMSPSDYRKNSVN